MYIRVYATVHYLRVATGPGCGGDGRCGGPGPFGTKRSFCRTDRCFTLAGSSGARSLRDAQLLGGGGSGRGGMGAAGGDVDTRGRRRGRAGRRRGCRVARAGCCRSRCRCSNSSPQLADCTPAADRQRGGSASPHQRPRAVADLVERSRRAPGRSRTPAHPERSSCHRQGVVRAVDCRPGGDGGARWRGCALRRTTPQVSRSGLQHSSQCRVRRRQELGVLEDRAPTGT